MATLYETLLGKLRAPNAPGRFDDPQYSGDPLDLLPAESRAKFERMAEEREAAQVIVRSRSDALNDARDNFHRIEAWARSAREQGPGVIVSENGHVTPSSDWEGLEARIASEIAPRKAALDKAITAYERATAAANAFAFVDDCRAWVNRYATSGGRLDFVELPKPTATGTAGVATIRAKLADIDKAWSEAQDAPAPRSDYLERALDEIDVLAEHGRLVLDLRNRGPNPLGLRDRLSVSLNTIALPPLKDGWPDDKHVALNCAGDVAAFLVWLHKDEITARIMAEIDAADDTGALKHDAREARFKKLSEQRLSLELQEESAIVHAAASGQKIARRRNADPRAILQVREI